MRLGTASTIAGMLVVALSSTACFGGTSNVTGSGKGLPVVTVDFPMETEAGSSHTAVVEVSNPGPEAIGSLFVAFSLVGAAEGGGLLAPLVAVGSRHKSPSVLAVRPEPRAVSPDGVVYRFDEEPSATGVLEPILPEGEAVSIAFDIRVPDRAGVAANSVQAYAGEEPERAQGVLLRTEVSG